jgi:hypothetical protein
MTTTSDGVREALGWRKRKADEISVSESEGSQQKRARRLTIFGDLSHQDDTPPVSRDDGEEATADEARPIVPMRMDYHDNVTQSMDQRVSMIVSDEMDRLLSPTNYMAHTGCPICELAENYSKDVRNGDDPNKTAALCFKLMTDFHHDNPHMSQPTKAIHLTKIYRLHAYKPICEANNGVAPKWLPKPSAKVMLYHIRHQCGDPVTDIQYAREYLKKNIALIEANTIVDGVLDLDAMKLGSKIALDLVKLHLQTAKLTSNRGGGNKMSLDRDQVFAFAGTKPIEALVSRQRNALGGAASNDNDALVNRTTNNRPVMGQLPDLMDDGDDDDDDLSDFLEEMVRGESVNIDTL